MRPPYGDGKFESTLTTNVANRKIGTKASKLLQNQALQLENLIHREGPVAVDSLGKRITGLKKLVAKYKNLTESNWVTQTFKKRFACTHPVTVAFNSINFTVMCNEAIWVG